MSKKIELKEVSNEEKGELVDIFLFGRMRCQFEAFLVHSASLSTFTEPPRTIEERAK